MTFLLACHYYYSTTAVPLYVFRYPYLVFVDTYPFCRVKPEDLSEREVRKEIYICAYPCALGQGESHE